MYVSFQHYISSLPLRFTALSHCMNKNDVHYQKLLACSRLHHYWLHTSSKNVRNASFPQPAYLAHFAFSGLSRDGLPPILWSVKWN